jgi:hypothetical protein
MMGQPEGTEGDFRFGGVGGACVAYTALNRFLPSVPSELKSQQGKREPFQKHQLNKPVYSGAEARRLERGSGIDALGAETWSEVSGSLVGIDCLGAMVCPGLRQWHSSAWPIEPEGDPARGEDDPEAGNLGLCDACETRAKRQGIGANSGANRLPTSHEMSVIIKLFAGDAYGLHIRLVPPPSLFLASAADRKSAGALSLARSIARPVRSSIARRATIRFEVETLGGYPRVLRAKSARAPDTVVFSAFGSFSLRSGLWGLHQLPAAQRVRQRSLAFQQQQRKPTWNV